MPSFLFKLDDIFEQFVRNSLRKVLNKTKLCVLDGNRQRKPIPLYHDNRDFLIKPDAIICQGKRVLAIVEMKYKPKIDESDRYQVISHVLATRAPLGVWVSPADEGSPEGLSYVGALSGGQRFYHYRLDLAGDLDSSQNKMSEDLLKLVLYLSSSEFSARYSCADQPSYAKA